MDCNSGPERTKEEIDQHYRPTKIFPGKHNQIDIKVTERENPIRYDPFDWDALGYNERRCENCDRWRRENGLGDFICRHIKGFKEAPAHVRRCDTCDKWKKSRRILGEFWCKHNKSGKSDWDRFDGWVGAVKRAREIGEWQRLVREAR